MVKKIFGIFILFFIIFPKQIKADMAAPGIWNHKCENKNETYYCTYMFKSSVDQTSYYSPLTDIANKIYIGENTCSKFESSDDYYQVSDNETYSYERYYYTNSSEEDVVTPTKEYVSYIRKPFEGELPPDYEGGSLQSIVRTVVAKFDDARDYPIIYSIKSFCTKLNDSTSSASCNLDEEKVNCNYSFKEINTDKYNIGVEIINNTCSKYEDNPKYRYLDGYGGRYTGGKTFCFKKDGTDYTFNEMHQIITKSESKNNSVEKTNNYQKKSIIYIGMIIFVIAIFSLKLIFHLKNKNKPNKRGPRK